MTDKIECRTESGAITISDQARTSAGEFTIRYPTSSMSHKRHTKQKNFRRSSLPGFDQSSFVGEAEGLYVAQEQRIDTSRRTKHRELSFLGNNLTRVFPVPATGNFFALLMAIDVAEQANQDLDVVRHT